ncbi:MAG TPA: hypothetical protein VG605_07285 [Puia sp.]|nr:hypothetical protein [Puia sp.]
MENVKKTRFKPNYQITIISGFGLAGIVVALLLLSIEKGPNTGSVFHEVGYFPRDVVDRAIQHFTDSLHGAIRDYRAKKRIYEKVVDDKPAGDTVDIARDSISHFSRHITQDSISVIALNNDRLYYEDSTITDTNALRIVTNWVHFGIPPNRVAEWDSAYRLTGRGWRDSVHYYARFPVNNRQFVYRGVAQFRIVTYKSNIQFMAKNPGAGIWVFLMVIFSGFCFIAIPASFYIMRQVLKIFKEEERPDQKGYWVTTPIVAGCLILLLVVLFHTFSDEPPVKDLFFMRTLGDFLLFANVLGCVAGAFCLAGFIHSASMLGYFYDKVKTQTTKVRVQREEVKMMAPAAGAAQAGVAALGTAAVDEEEVKHKEYADQFRRLLGFFHRYFILSAILLSMVVVCTGALYNAANSLSFLKLLSANWGYSPAGGDAVYLFGGLFTAILLLVYLPAKMQFGDVQLQLPRGEGMRDDDDEDSKWYGLLEQPFSWLRGGLIAASPFLLGLIQGLLGLFMKH